MSWGTVEEIHRRLCFVVLAHRYLYYVCSTPILTDRDYDLLERYLIWFEKVNCVTHDKSPVRTVGSDNEWAYPYTSKAMAKYWIKNSSGPQAWYINIDDELKNRLLRMKVVDNRVAHGR